MASAGLDLAVGGVPDGDPGPAAEELFGRDLLLRPGHDIDPDEQTLFYTADAFQAELRQPYPRCYDLQFRADYLKNSLLGWIDRVPPGDRMFDGVVAGSRILAYLARAFLVTRKRKRDCYTAWADCQRHLRELFQVVVRAISPVFRRRVLNGWRVVEAAAAEDGDAVRTISSDDFSPDGDSDNSQNDYDISMQFRRRDRQEVHRQRRLASREYALFCNWLSGQPGGAQLLATFREDLMNGYIGGQFPSPPVDPVGEPLPDIPRYIRDDDDSSVEDLYDEEYDDDSDGGWQVEVVARRGVGAVGAAGLGQGEAVAPAVYGLVVDGMHAVIAEMEGPTVAVAEEENSDMEDLF